MERAARWAADQARRLAGNRSQPFLVDTDTRQAVHQADGVGMPGRLEDGVHVAVLDDLAGVHDDYPLGELGDEAEIVGDQDRRRMRLVLGLLQHLQDLGLDRHVQRRCRLVGDEQLR